MVFFALHVKDYLLSSLFLPQLFSSQMDARHSAKKKKKPDPLKYMYIARRGWFTFLPGGP